MADSELETELKKKLLTLPERKQLAFALVLCERMMPAMRIFAKETNFAYDIYEQCLSHAWKALEGNDRFDRYAEMAEKCLRGAPNTEDFDNPLVSSALNTALSISAVMMFLSDTSLDHIVEAADLACETVAAHTQRYVAKSPLALSVKQIMEHPAMRQEVAQQLSDFAFLESLPSDASQDFVTQSKNRAELAPKLFS